MDVEVDVRGLGGGPQRLRPALVGVLRALVALRVAEEELAQPGTALLGGGDRVGRVDVGSEAGGVSHGPTLGRATDGPAGPR